MKLRSGISVLTALISLMIPAVPAEARDLLGRMGLGYNSQFGHTSSVDGSPGISLKYGLAPKAAIELVAGFYSGANGSGVAAAKYLKTVHSDNYANFYFLLGAGYVYTRSKNGAEFLGGLGSEFFIPGVDNLGISFEAGMSAESYSSSLGSFVLKTFGVSFLNAGMHYYF